MIEIKDTSIAILLGGFGTRIRNYAPNLPKALIPIHGVPFIQHLINYFIQQGIQHLVFFVNYRANQIYDYIQLHNKNKSITIDFIYDGKYPKGTGGAIKSGLSLLSDPFFIQYGDTMLPICYHNLVDIYNRKNKSVMTVLHNNNKGDVSNVLFKNHTLLNYDKQSPTDDMRYIDYGLMLFNHALFDLHKEEKFDLSLIMKKGVLDHKIQGLEVDQLFYEVGSLEGIQQTENFFQTYNNSI